MANSPNDASKPNIITILVDDMGYSDLGCYGSEINTPHLDDMATNGMRFSSMYNVGRCCPSRACLLTGMYPHQAGVGHMVRDLGPTAYQGYLRPDVPTVAEIMHTAGYRTLLSGKWHVGSMYQRSDASTWIRDPEKRPLPVDRGFDEWYGTPSGAGSFWNPKPLYHNDQLVETTDTSYYYTDAVTDNAVRMIHDAARDETPFFLYLAYTAPHWPLHAHEEDIAHYEGKFMGGWDNMRTSRHEELKSMGILSDRWDISPRDDNAPAWQDTPNHRWEDRRMAVYAAMLEEMDRGIGRVRAALAEHGLSDNTLILFMSDNGGSPELLGEEGQRAREWRTTVDGRPVRFGNNPDIDPGGPDTYQSYGLPWSNASNTPFRLFKSRVHEGGISTPMIAHWPDAIPAGTIQHGVTHLVDLLPTFMEMGGATRPATFNDAPTQSLEGESMLSALRGDTLQWARSTPLCWEHEGNRAVRDGRWKLVNQHPHKWELYDMETDRTELTDLAEKDTPRLEKMKAQYADWADRCGVLPWEDIRPTPLGKM